MSQVVILVEDPGAANFMANLPAGLARAGIACRLVATGAAMGYLAGRGVAFTPLQGPAEGLLASSPDLVLVGTSENPDNPAFALISACRHRGVACWGAADYPGYPERRFAGRTGDPTAYRPDLLLVPDQGTADNYAAVGFPSAMLSVVGHPHFDHVRAAGADLLAGRDGLRRRLFPDLPEDRPIVVFGGENTLELLRDDTYTLEGCSGSAQRTTIVAEEFLAAMDGLRDRVSLVLRLHPKMTDQECASYAHRFDRISRGGPSLDVLAAADAVVGITSMLLAEAVLLGRPALAIVPRPLELSWLGAIASGLIPAATTRDAIREQCLRLVRDLRAPDRQAVDRQLPPGAEDRVVNAIAARCARSAQNRKDSAGW
jgi:hypothetical protein